MADDIPPPDWHARMRCANCEHPRFMHPMTPGAEGAYLNGLCVEPGCMCNGFEEPDLPENFGPIDLMGS